MGDALLRQAQSVPGAPQICGSKASLWRLFGRWLDSSDTLRAARGEPTPLRMAEGRVPVDRTALSGEIIAEVVGLFGESLKRNATYLVESDLDGIDQRLQEMARAVFGPLVERVIVAITESVPSEPPECTRCHRRMRPVDYQRVRILQGLVGDYQFARPYFVYEHCHRGLAPVDEHLGIGPGAFSPGLQRVACRLGIADSFEIAADMLHETLCIEVVTETTRRATEAIGEVAEAEAQAAIARAKGGREPLATEEIKATSLTLLVEVDGVMVHEVDGNWHEVKCGLAAPLGPKTREDKQTGRTTLVMGKPSYCAGTESAEDFWYRLYVEACRCGLGGELVAQVVVLGDGADWIWRHASAFLAIGKVEIVEIVDIYHALEHLARLANAVWGQGTAAAEAWTGRMRERLAREGAAAALAAMRALEPENEAAANEVRKAIAYFTEHKERMDYPRFIAQTLPIGSGAIESTCKTLIQKREKGAGMRWTQEGAQSIAPLRAVQRSGRWESFWKTRPQRQRPGVHRLGLTKAPSKKQDAWHH